MDGRGRTTDEGRGKEGGGCGTQSKKEIAKNKDGDYPAEIERVRGGRVESQPRTGLGSKGKLLLLVRARKHSLGLCVCS